MAKWLLVLALVAVLFGLVRALSRGSAEPQAGRQPLLAGLSGIDPALAVRATFLLLAALIVAYHML